MAACSEQDVGGGFPNDNNANYSQSASRNCSSERVHRGSKTIERITTRNTPLKEKCGSARRASAGGFAPSGGGGFAVVEDGDDCANNNSDDRSALCGGGRSVSRASESAAHGGSTSAASSVAPRRCSSATTDLSKLDQDHFQVILEELVACRAKSEQSEIVQKLHSECIADDDSPTSLSPIAFAARIDFSQQQRHLSDAGRNSHRDAQRFQRVDPHRGLATPVALSGNENMKMAGMGRGQPLRPRPESPPIPGGGREASPVGGRQQQRHDTVTMNNSCPTSLSGATCTSQCDGSGDCDAVGASLTTPLLGGSKWKAAAVDLNACNKHDDDDCSIYIEMPNVTEYSIYGSDGTVSAAQPDVGRTGNVPYGDGGARNDADKHLRGPKAIRPRSKQVVSEQVDGRPLIPSLGGGGTSLNQQNVLPSVTRYSNVDAVSEGGGGQQQVLGSGGYSALDSQRRRRRKATTVRTAEDIAGHRGSESVETLLKYIHGDDATATHETTTNNNNGNVAAAKSNKNTSCKKNHNNGTGGGGNGSSCAGGNGNNHHSSCSAPATGDAASSGGNKSRDMEEDVLNNNVVMNGVGGGGDSSDSASSPTAGGNGRGTSRSEERSDLVSSPESQDGGEVVVTSHQVVAAASSSSTKANGGGATAVATRESALVRAQVRSLSPSFYSDHGGMGDNHSDIPGSMGSFSDAEGCNSEFRVVVKKKKRRTMLASATGSQAASASNRHSASRQQSNINNSSTYPSRRPANSSFKNTGPSTVQGARSGNGHSWSRSGGGNSVDETVVSSNSGSRPSSRRHMGNATGNRGLMGHGQPRSTSQERRRKSASSVPHSEASDSDADSVHSLPVGRSPKHHRGGPGTNEVSHRPHTSPSTPPNYKQSSASTITSYADIIRGAALPFGRSAPTRVSPKPAAVPVSVTAPATSPNSCVSLQQSQCSGPNTVSKACENPSAAVTSVSPAAASECEISSASVLSSSDVQASPSSAMAAKVFPPASPEQDFPPLPSTGVSPLQTTHTKKNSPPQPVPNQNHTGSECPPSISSHTEFPPMPGVQFAAAAQDTSGTTEKQTSNVKDSSSHSDENHSVSFVDEPDSISDACNIHDLPAVVLPESPVISRSCSIRSASVEDDDQESLSDGGGISFGFDINEALLRGETLNVSQDDKISAVSAQQPAIMVSTVSGDNQDRSRGIFNSTSASTASSTSTVPFSRSVAFRAPSHSQNNPPITFHHVGGYAAARPYAAMLHPPNAVYVQDLEAGHNSGVRKPHPLSPLLPTPNPANSCNYDQIVKFLVDAWSSTNGARAKQRVRYAPT